MASWRIGLCYAYRAAFFDPTIASPILLPTLGPSVTQLTWQNVSGMVAPCHGAQGHTALNLCCPFPPNREVQQGGKGTQRVAGTSRIFLQLCVWLDFRK